MWEFLCTSSMLMFSNFRHVQRSMNPSVQPSATSIPSSAEVQQSDSFSSMKHQHLSGSVSDKASQVQLRSMSLGVVKWNIPIRQGEEAIWMSSKEKFWSQFIARMFSANCCTPTQVSTWSLLCFNCASDLWYLTTPWLYLYIGQTRIICSPCSHNLQYRK